jgi:hypothetical protein
MVEVSVAHGKDFTAAETPLYFSFDRARTW